MTQRPPSAARGYGHAWQKLRARVPPAPCAMCDAPFGSGMALDHLKPRAEGGTDDISNLRWLCRRCHARKTARCDGGFGHARRIDKNILGHGVDAQGRPRAPNHPWNKKTD